MKCHGNARLTLHGRERPAKVEIEEEADILYEPNTESTPRNAFTAKVFLRMLLRKEYLLVGYGWKINRHGVYPRIQ